jgi:hypothetical protein
VTSNANTDLSLAADLFDQSSLTLKLATNATGLLSENRVVPGLSRI